MNPDSSDSCQRQECFTTECKSCSSFIITPSDLTPHPALRSFGAEHLGVDRTEPRSDEAGQPQNRPTSIVPRNSEFNPNAKPILALRMPDGRNLIVSGRTSHQIALADPTCKAVKTTLIDYDPAIHTDEWVQMTNAGEHIINRTATTEHFRTYFTHNPITHAQAIEQGLVPIDPRTRRPSAAYTKGRQLAEQDLAAKEQAEQQAAAASAAETKAQAEKTLPGKTKWATPTKKAKPLSDSETRQTLISVAALGLSKRKRDRFAYLHTLTQRIDGTEYTVATDGRRLTVISQPTYKPDTDDTTQEWHTAKGEQAETGDSAPGWTRYLDRNYKAETTIDLSHYSFLAKGSIKGSGKDGKRLDSPYFNSGQHIVIPATAEHISLAPMYIRDMYKQVVELGKKFGFSPIVKLQYNDASSPVLFSAEHNGIKWQYILMPVQRNKEATPGDIILGRQPTIYGEETTQDTGSFSLRAKGLVTRFNAIRNASPIVIATPSAFQPDIKAAIKSVRESYRELQNNPVTMKDGRLVRFSGSGFLEIKNHAADRRVVAVIPKLKELCESAEYMYSAPNSEPDKVRKADISQYHYYLNKASFAGLANDAYILIAVAERTNGEFFYDLDATDIETIENVKGTTNTLAATRVPNSGQQGGVPKGRIHNLKEVVNSIEQNLPITATEAAPLFQDGVMQAANAIVTEPSFSIKAIKAPFVTNVDAAKEALKKIQGKTFTNGEVSATVSGQTIGKTHAAHMSVRNLKALGYDEDEARKIHYSACAKIHEIFESAEYGFFEPNYDTENKKGRAGAWHYLGVVEVDGYGEFDVNVTAIQTTKESDANPLFTLELTIENPSGVSGDTLSQRGRALRSEGFSERRLAAYQSFVEKEIASIKKNAIENGTFMLAPNGKKSNLNERQWLHVRTRAFKKWFGDWENDPENASKVVDENWEPKVFYHGSPHYGFTVFDKARRGERDKGDFGRGFYFTPSRGYAATYGKDGYWNAEGDDSKVYACFLNIREPMQVQARRAENMERWRFEDAEGVMVFVDRYDDRAWDDLKNLSEIVVHESTQIKSATDNRGTYSKASADITLSLRRRPERNAAVLLNERETTLLRVANYIKREARRTARVLGADTEKLRAGVHLSQATAIITALDKYIFSRDLITRNSEEYRRLRALRNYAEQYITIAGNGKLPTRRATKDGHITIKAAIRELLETQLPASCNARSSPKCRRRFSSPQGACPVLRLALKTRYRSW